MPRDHRDGPITIRLSGERAERLAHRLLAPQPASATDALLAEIAALGGHGARVSHDWDPATRHLTLIAQSG